MPSFQKILLIGPESTGKTVCAQQLATHFNTVYAPEYVRLYLQAKADAQLPLPESLLAFGEIEGIALGQYAGEQHAATMAKQWLFCDAGVLSTEVYSNYYFGKVPSGLAALIEKSNYQGALLFKPDLAWQPDWLRDPSADREALFQLFEAVLKKYGIPYGQIGGEGDARLQCALDWIKSIRLLR